MWLVTAASNRFRYARGQGELTPLDEEVIQSWCDLLLENKHLKNNLKYWTKDRFVTEGTLRQLNIGWHPKKRRYTIPVYSSNGKIVDVKLYRPGETEYGKSIHYTEKREGMEMRWGSPVRLYGIERLVGITPGKGRLGVVLIVAGEPDAILAKELGYLAVSPTSGEGALCRREDIEVILKGGWPVRVLMDTDTAGRSAAELWLNALADIGVTNLKDVILPLEGEHDKDLTDWVGKNGSGGVAAGLGLELWEIVRATPKWKADLSPAKEDNQRGSGRRDLPARGGKGGTRRPIEDLLAMAMAKIEETGSRNKAGFFFWCQVRDERYSRDEGFALLDQYVDAANEYKPGPPPYTKKECIDSLEEAFRQPPREPNGFESDFNNTDLGNARRFIHEFEDRVAWVPAWGDWAVWAGNHWNRGTAPVEMLAREVPAMILAEAKEIPGASKAKSSLMKHSKASESAGRLAAMLRLAQAEVTVPAEKFDGNARVINVQNGTLYLSEDKNAGNRGVVFREHSREDYSTTTASTAWVPGMDWKKSGRVFNKFLKDTMPDPEVLEYFQRLVGYSILGINPERKFVIIHGPTASGKSTISNILHRVFDGYVATFRLSLLREKQEEGPRPDIVTLLSKRMIIASEASTSWHLHADQVKSITGNEPITARQMQAKEYVTRVPAFTPWLLTNQIPQIREADEALWRRLVAIKFGVTRTPDEEDRNLEKKIMREASAVLAWVMEGYQNYLAHGLDDVPVAIMEHTLAVREQMTDIDQWISFFCESAAEYSESVDDLYDNYLTWCFSHGLSDRDKLNKQAFSRALDGRQYQKGTRRKEGPAGPPDTNTYYGIRLAREDANSEV